MIPRTKGFKPLLCDEPQILILGTLPGRESLEHHQYYYSKSNRIWKVLCYLTGEPMPIDYDQKQALLAKYHIALWDYYESAIRPNSSKDNCIRDGHPNDIVHFLAEHPSIKVIGINGHDNYDKFGVQIEKTLTENPDMTDVQVLKLPNTSSNNNWRYDLKKLAEEWKCIFNP